MKSGLKLSVVVLLGLAGCQSYYGSGYTGNYDIPQGGIYAPQRSGMTVVPPTNPPNTTWQRQGAPGAAGANAMTQPATTQPATPSNAASSNGQKLVPDPIDAGGSSTRDPADLPEESRNGRGTRSPSGVELDSISDAGEEEVAAQNDDDKFADPLPVHPVSTTTTRRQPAEPAASRPNPYNYDRKGYTWLRGVLSFDEQDKAWFITYNPEPDERDLYGGRLTFLNSAELMDPLANDVVYVEGQIANNQTDRFGKPMFRVTRAQRLVVRKTANSLPAASETSNSGI